MNLSHCWVVTGAAGFLGSHVVDELVARGVPTLAIDDFSVGKGANLGRHEGNPHFRVVRLDVRDTGRLNTLFQAHRPAAVIHLAAIHFIPACIADPPRAVSLNVHGTQSVLTAAQKAEVDRFWFASTGDVYAPAETPHDEEGLVAPFNIYGLSKWIGEHLVALEAKQRPSSRFVVGRLFNLYGPRETNPHILPEILSQLAPGLKRRCG